jgi:hypothetical protein
MPNWLRACGALGAPALSDTRTLLLLISYKEYEAVGSACRTASCLSRARKVQSAGCGSGSACVSILSSLINTLYVVVLDLSLDPLPSPPLLGFNLAPVPLAVRRQVT